MEDLFSETFERDKLFREALEKAHRAWLKEHWNELDEMTKTTMRVLHPGVAA